MENAAQAVQAAVDAITAMDDPETRARAASAVLGVFAKGNGTLAKLRREDVITLRKAGMSYGEIGTAIGVHRSRVRQIESGAPMGNSARGRAAKADPAA